MTKDNIRVRDIVYDENVWSPPLANKVPVDRSIMLETSDEITGHAMEMDDVIQSSYDRANKLYGTDENPAIAD